MKEFIEKYSERVSKYSTLRFILELTVWCFVLKLVFAIIFVSLFAVLGLNTETDLSFEQGILEKSLPLIVILIILFATFETLVGQWLMIKIASFFTKKIFYQILFSAFVFALMHLDFIFAFVVFPIGLVLAWSFIIQRRLHSLKAAIWVTTLIHVLHNLIALAAIWKFI